MSVSLEPKILNDLLNFLKDVHLSKICHNGEIYLRNAWRRYEVLWIPLLRKRGSYKEDALLQPPLDVHWMWHLHFHNPIAYSKDLDKSGGILDHGYANGSVDKTRAIWRAAYPNEPFDAPLDAKEIREFLGHFQTSFSYNLIEASKRQQDFFYQVSLPHYKSIDFQRKCIQRYIMFLDLKSLYLSEFVVPYYDIDLAWHAHMSKPLEYKEETSKKLGGSMLNHDDSVEKESLDDSHKRTADIWKETYSKDYLVPGVAHRGEPPNGKLPPIPSDLDAPHFLKGTMKCLKLNPYIYFTLPNPTKKPVEYELHLKVTECSLLGKKCLVDIKKSSFTSSNSSYILLFDIKKEPLITINAYSSILFEVDVRKSISGFFRQSSKLKYVAGFYKKMSQSDHEDLSLKLNSYCKKFQLNIHLTNSSVLCHDNYCSPYKIVNILPGSYYDCIIPENIESLWGPIPLKKLPEGQDNCCKAVVHAIVDNDSRVLTVHLVHSLKLRMSCVQTFLGEHRMSVAHLIDANTLSISHIDAFKKFEYSPWRGMIIKDGDGDWGVLVGHWTGLTKPIFKQGKCVQPGKPGYFTCSFINFRSRQEMDFKLPNGISNVFKGQEFSIDIPNKISVNLESGEIIYHSGIGNEVIQYTTLSFAISILYLLVLPTPRDLDAPKPKNLPEKYQPLYFKSIAPLFFVYCGIRSIGNMPANSTIYHSNRSSLGIPMTTDLQSNTHFVTSSEEASVDLNAYNEDCFDSGNADIFDVFNSVDVGGSNFDGFGESSGMDSLFMGLSGMESMSWGSSAVDGGGGNGGDGGGGDGGGCGGGCGG